MQGAAKVNRQEERSLRTREHVLRSTVELIRREGLSSASPVRIARHTGLSWGAVQHHFGSKEELLRRIVLLSRDEFGEAVTGIDYGGLDLRQRISLFVDCAWRHYQSDVFMAAVEIALWHRNNNSALGDDIAEDDGQTAALILATVETVFAGLGAKSENLVEASVYVNCVLTGLAVYDVFSGGNAYILRHLEQCKISMEEIITEQAGHVEGKVVPMSMPMPVIPNLRSS